MAKQTSAGIIQDLINSRDEAVPLAELVAAVQAVFPHKLEAQVYADTQSLATHGKIGRGKNARTYCKAALGLPREQRETSSTSPTRARNKSGVPISVPAVLAYLESELGAPVERPKDRPTYAVSLVGTADGEYILNGATSTLKKRPDHWCHWIAGVGKMEVTIVGFLW